jgi:hypothetical protein
MLGELPFQVPALAMQHAVAPERPILSAHDGRDAARAASAPGGDRRGRGSACRPEAGARGGLMAEFIEVPITREDGSEALHYINIEAISYIDSHIGQEGEGRTLTVHLADGYWFTLSGPKAAEMATLIKNHSSGYFKGDAREN